MSLGAVSERFYLAKFPEIHIYVGLRSTDMYCMYVWVKLESKIYILRYIAIQYTVQLLMKRSYNGSSYPHLSYVCKQFIS